ncbi:Hypothetical protein A7982_11464 [Minicystis rosea]|nr:Hypothetical protein A7982_11464 [Minicystis rosea]
MERSGSACGAVDAACGAAEGDSRRFINDPANGPLPSDFV